MKWVDTSRGWLDTSGILLDTLPFVGGFSEMGGHSEGWLDTSGISLDTYHPISPAICEIHLSFVRLVYDR